MKKVNQNLVSDLMAFSARVEETKIKSIAEIEMSIEERKQRKVIFNNVASYSLN